MADQRLFGVVVGRIVLLKIQPLIPGLRHVSQSVSAIASRAHEVVTLFVHLGDDVPKTGLQTAMDAFPHGALLSTGTVSVARLGGTKQWSRK